MKKKKYPTISLCMIVKNEEDVIERCLSSIKDAVDEIIIIDTGSTDRTKEIVSKFTDCVYDFEWINDFGAARNFSFSKATKDYLLWLDADDTLTVENVKKLKNLKKTLTPDVDAVSMAYYLTVDEKGNPTYQSRRNRLVKRERNFKWHGFVHEYLEVYGNIISSDIAILHKKEKQYSDRNIKLYEAALAAGKEFSPRDTYYYANECLDHLKFEPALEYYEKFLTDGLGWVEDNINACGKIADCYIHLKEWSKAVNASIRSFEYDLPRAELLCRLGYLNIELKRLDHAIYWYKLAADAPVPDGKAPFINYPCYTWIPNLQLCVCYSQQGDLKLAKKYNDIAASHNPTHPAVLHNQSFLATVLK